jgi:hypothetical protein
MPQSNYGSGAGPGEVNERKAQGIGRKAQGIDVAVVSVGGLCRKNNRAHGS